MHSLTPFFRIVNHRASLFAQQKVVPNLLHTLSGKSLYCGFNYKDISNTYLVFNKTCPEIRQNLIAE